LFHNPDRGSGQVNQIPYSQFMSDVDNGKVHDVVIVDQSVSGKYTNGGSFQTTAPRGEQYVKQLIDKNVTVELRQAGETFNLVGA
ncbi:ATP-dependent metallopeptidase FtsH/Yme1/Tma family protein, partial [Acinetobacter baumannii]